ncbi:hypothetical protein PENSPDRAFT_695058 [Peniophora sp. CONT]|nr:hypothetical protein PENSPDRAFT_695058 [Peniophora sp. CONT]
MSASTPRLPRRPKGNQAAEPQNTPARRSARALDPHPGVTHGEFKQFREDISAEAARKEAIKQAKRDEKAANLQSVADREREGVEKLKMLGLTAEELAEVEADPEANDTPQPGSNNADGVAGSKQALDASSSPSKGRAVPRAPKADAVVAASPTTASKDGSSQKPAQGVKRPPSTSVSSSTPPAKKHADASKVVTASTSKSKKLKQGLEGLVAGWDDQPSATARSRGAQEEPVRGAFTDKDTEVSREDADALERLQVGSKSGRNKMISVSTPRQTIGLPKEKKKRKSANNSSSSDSDSGTGQPVRTRGVRKRPGTGLEQVEPHIRPFMVAEVQPTLYDWLGRLPDPWKLDYTSDEDTLTFSDVLQQAYDAVCEDHDVVSPWKKVVTTHIFYKRGRQCVIDARMAVYDVAEREFRSFLVRELTELDDAATPAKAAKEFKKVSPEMVQAFVEDQLETQAWWYERPATATSNGSGVAGSWLMLNVFGTYLKSVDGSLIDFGSMGPPAGALALCAVACDLTVKAWATGAYKKPEFNMLNCQLVTQEYLQRSVQDNFCGAREHRFAKLITRARAAVSVKKPALSSIQVPSAQTHKSVIYAIDASSEPEPEPQSDGEDSPVEEGAGEDPAKHVGSDVAEQS